MKKITLILFGLILSVSSYSQEMDNRLLSAYSIEELNIIKSQDNELYKALIYGLDNNATYLSQIPSEKLENFDHLPEIELPAGEYNFASLGIKIKENESQTFRVKDTNLMLIVKSAYVLKHELKSIK